MAETRPRARDRPARATRLSGARAAFCYPQLAENDIACKREPAPVGSTLLVRYLEFHVQRPPGAGGAASSVANRPGARSTNRPPVFTDVVGARYSLPDASSRWPARTRGPPNSWLPALVTDFCRAARHVFAKITVASPGMGVFLETCASFESARTEVFPVARSLILAAL